MADIHDRIAKLLALADSPNEHEAKAALLKARALMAEHKLRPEDITRKENVKVRVETVGIFCTKMTDTWAADLSAVIAGHYCCKAHRTHHKRAKKVEIGFAGLEDDFEICKRIYLYTYGCVKDRCKEIRARAADLDYSGKVIREMCNAYGIGFCRGLLAAFQEQEAQHQEWGLVLKIPKEVNDATSHHKPAQVYGDVREDGWRKTYTAEGFQDGKRFDVGRRLDVGEKDTAAVPALQAGGVLEYTAYLPQETYRRAQALLDIPDISALSPAYRLAMDIHDDSCEPLLCAEYPDGTRIILSLCAGQNNYYVVTKVVMPGLPDDENATERISYALPQRLVFHICSREYVVHIQFQRKADGDPTKLN